MRYVPLLVILALVLSGCLLPGPSSSPSPLSLPNTTSNPSSPPTLNVTIRSANELLLTETDVPQYRLIAAQDGQGDSLRLTSSPDLKQSALTHLILNISRPDYNPPKIEQRLSLYSSSKAHELYLQLAGQQGKTQTGLITFETLPSPKIGEESMALKTHLTQSPDGLRTYSIFFRKLNVIEYINVLQFENATMSAEDEYAFARQVAQTAADKIQ